MEARLFLEEYSRMCDACYDPEYGCEKCYAVKRVSRGCCFLDVSHPELDAEALVSAVEAWHEDNPRTREGEKNG